MKSETLTRPFDTSLIKCRKGNGGVNLHYVEGAEYIKRLNDAFEHDWSFELIEYTIKDTEVIVIGKLTAGGITKMAFGGSALTLARETGTVISTADDLKAAATDALKKACSLWGLGLHLYESPKPGLALVKQEPSTPPHAIAAPSNRLSAKQHTAILRLGQALHLSASQLQARSRATFQRPLEALDRREASKLIQTLGAERALGS